MRGKKKLSPFARLTREIEAYIADIAYQSQLCDLQNIEVNDQFVLGQFYALRFILERAYAISYDRAIGNELIEITPAQFIEYFREARKTRES